MDVRLYPSVYWTALILGLHHMYLRRLSIFRWRMLVLGPYDACRVAVLWFCHCEDGRVDVFKGLRMSGQITVYASSTVHAAGMLGTHWHRCFVLAAYRRKAPCRPVRIGWVILRGERMVIEDVGSKPRLAVTIAGVATVLLSATCIVDNVFGHVLSRVSIHDRETRARCTIKRFCGCTMRSPGVELLQ